LTTSDATGLDLKGTEVVALTNCEAGAADGAAWDLAALQRAFVLAGARAVLTSLWAVPDEPRRELLTDFYRRLVAGTACGEALREALRQLRAAYPDPAVWGAFLCQGTAEKR
jgi:CHAT domain-containing protein